MRRGYPTVQEFRMGMTMVEASQLRQTGRHDLIHDDERRTFRGAATVHFRALGLGVCGHCGRLAMVKSNGIAGCLDRQCPNRYGLFAEIGWPWGKPDKIAGLR